MCSGASSGLAGQSFVFKKIEGITLSEQLITPALSMKYLPTEVGSDFAHQLGCTVLRRGPRARTTFTCSSSPWIIDHLLQTYDIEARCLISAYNELRHLVAGFASRGARASNRELTDVMLVRLSPRNGYMSCVTPSHPKPIPSCESLNVEQVQERTGSTLWADGRPMEEPGEEEEARRSPPKCMRHRAKSATWLRAQATNSFAEIKYLAQQESGVKFVGDVGSGSGGRSRTRGREHGVAPPEPDEQESEWADVLQREMKRIRMK